MLNNKFQKIYRQILLQEIDFLSMANQPEQKKQSVFVDFLDDTTWDDQKKVKKLKSQLSKMKSEMQKNKIQPKKAKEELKILYNTAKQHNPEIAKQIKNDIKQDLQIIKKSQIKSVQKKGKTTIQKKESTHEIKNFNANEIAYKMIRKKYKKRFIDILNQYKSSSDKEVKNILFFIYKTLKRNRPTDGQREMLEDNLTELLTIDTGKELVTKLIKLSDKIEDEIANEKDDKDNNDANTGVTFGAF